MMIETTKPSMMRWIKIDLAAEKSRDDAVKRPIVEPERAKNQRERGARAVDTAKGLAAEGIGDHPVL